LIAGLPIFDCRSLQLATYVLPFGGWGRPKPSDLDNPAYAVLLPILGWLLLLVLAVLAR